MKIVNITKANVYYIETDESNYFFYIRYGKDNWVKRIDDIEKYVSNYKELEKQFQENNRKRYEID